MEKLLVIALICPPVVAILCHFSPWKTPEEAAKAIKQGLQRSGK